MYVGNRMQKAFQHSSSPTVSELYAEVSTFSLQSMHVHTHVLHLCLTCEHTQFAAVQQYVMRTYAICTHTSVYIAVGTVVLDPWHII